MKIKTRNDRAELTLQRGKPIDVPAAEVTGLEPGDSILAILKSETDRTGYIATVKRSNQLVGVRGLR